MTYAEKCIPAWREIEPSITRAAASLSTLGALLPAAWITADRLIVYLHIAGPAACIMAGAVEWLGLQIVATRTKLIGLDMPVQVKSMNMAFGGYLLIIVSVNGVLSICNMYGWDAWGRVVAEMILGLMALPVSALSGVNKQLDAIDAAKRLADERVAAGNAAALAGEAARAKIETDRQVAIAQAENAAKVALEKLHIEERAAKRHEKNAVKTETAQPQPQAAVIDYDPAADKRSRDEIAAAFIPAYFAQNGRLPSLSEVGRRLGVKASQASAYRAKYK